MCLIFEFDGESMINEKVYFDLNTPLPQLGIGDDYNSLRPSYTRRSPPHTTDAIEHLT
jgi:hypothetical protein